MSGSFGMRIRHRFLVAVGRIKPLVPRRARPAVVWAIDVLDSVRRQGVRMRGGPRVPPPSLRRRVGSVSLSHHLRFGGKGASDIEGILEDAGHPMRRGDRVLDWGCGAGRIALELLPRNGIDLHGCDVDHHAIDWLRRVVPDGARRFQVSGFAPPLPYEDGSFDVVYASSVFTHLNQDDQLTWLRELSRILAPNGIGLFTTAGPTAFDRAHWAGMPKATAEQLAPFVGQLEELGFVFASYEDDLVEKPDKWPGISGDYGLAFQTEWWTREHWTDALKIQRVVAAGLDDYQDAVVAAKPGA